MGLTPRLASLLGRVYNIVSGILYYEESGFFVPLLFLRNFFLFSCFQERSHVVFLCLLELSEYLTLLEVLNQVATLCSTHCLISCLSRLCLILIALVDNDRLVNGTKFNLCSSPSPQPFPIIDCYKAEEEGFAHH